MAPDATREPEDAPSPPTPLLTLTEPLRTLWDLAALAADFPLLWNEAPGDGHPVVVLPGFLLDDQSTWPLRTFLTILGYRAYGFSLGQNLGARTVGRGGAALTQMVERLVGREPVSLIGHSLGGVLARDFVRKHPDRVRRVITLGSPYVGDERSMPRSVVQLRRHLTREQAHELADHSPLPAPHTIVYSRSDGVVSAFDCRHPDPGADNVEVPGSHIGLIVNSSVFRIIANRLRIPAAQTPSAAQLWADQGAQSWRNPGRLKRGSADPAPRILAHD
jgi:pimeloyl-ACP methyl ester carboxylesterase